MSQKKTKTTPTNKTILKAGFRVGYPSAEDDTELLRECFIGNDAFDVLTDVAQPGSIVLGRTGAGKSALIMRVLDTAEHKIPLEPSDLALNHISNSTIIGFFEELGVNFDLFFRLLWRHVLCVEILNYHYNVRKKGDFERAVDGLRDFFNTNQSKKLALDYMSSWGSKFWEESQERVKELVDRFEDQLKAGVNLTNIGVPIEMGASSRVETSKKIEIVAEATKVINSIQIRKLSSIMDLISDDILTDKHKKYYITIDRLDENWVDDGLRYKLIRALLETIKDFKKVRNVKIIVSMRTDLIERVYRYTKDSGFQEEKYEALNVNVKWDSKALFDLIDRRICFVFKKQYTKDDVHFYDIFDAEYRQAGPTFEYLAQRTQYRPRDIIAFANEIFEHSAGKYKIGANDIDKAETEYSRKRISALCSEWAVEHPNLEACMEVFRRKPTRIDVDEMTADSLQQFITRLMVLPDAPDQLPQLARSYVNSTGDESLETLRAHLIAVLYKVGAIGVRLRRGEPVHFVYESSFVLKPADITTQTRLSISPMLWAGLGCFRQRVRGDATEGLPN